SRRPSAPETFDGVASELRSAFRWASGRYRFDAALETKATRQVRQPSSLQRCAGPAKNNNAIACDVHSRPALATAPPRLRESATCGGATPVGQRRARTR